MPSPNRTILVATDLSARSDRPMQRGILLAEQLGAQLLVLHVPGSGHRLDAAEEQRLKQQVADEFDIAGAEVLLEYGSVPDVITDVARDRESALLITGVARFNSPRDYLLGTAVDYLVRRSQIPVLVVKRRARRPYERLLAATDFSECSAEAVRSAAALFPQARVRIAHSYQPAFEAFLERDSSIGLIRDEAEQAMKRFVDSLPEDVRDRAELVTAEGLGTVIAEKARDWRSDLLVVGSHGRGGFVHAKIGRTAAELLQSADCDVLIVREN